jgi:hypothetical protein
VPRIRLVVLVLIVQARAWAGFPDSSYRVLPCRPTVSCTAELVPPGTLELEAGYLARSIASGGFVHAQPFLAKLTLVERLQVQVGSNGKVITSGRTVSEARYLDDISIGLKTKLVDETRAVPSMAVSAAISIPSWDRHPDFPFAYDASFWAYASKDVGPFHFDLNGGLNVWEFDLSPTYQPFVSLALGAPLAGGFGAILEGYAFADGGARIAPKDTGILTGLTFAPEPWIMFDAGVDVGAARQLREWSLFTGLTVIPYDFWDTAKEKAPR